MSPRLHGTVRIQRGILVKHMIFPVKLTQSIRIIEPSDRRHQMQCQPVWIFFNLFLSLFRLFRFFPVICSHIHLFHHNRFLSYIYGSCFFYMNIRILVGICDQYRCGQVIPCFFDCIHIKFE